MFERVESSVKLVMTPTKDSAGVAITGIIGCVLMQPTQICLSSWFAYYTAQEVPVSLHWLEKIVAFLIALGVARGIFRLGQDMLSHLISTVRRA